MERRSIFWRMLKIGNMPAGFFVIRKRFARNIYRITEHDSNPGGMNPTFANSRDDRATCPGTSGE
jgi:hypothetical protein